jgi:CHAT domain-containing protein
MRQAAELYDRLVAPVAAWLTGGALTVAPDGVLHAVPWAMLPGDKGPLVDRYRLRLLPTATALRAPPPPQKPWSPRLLALGDPETGRDGMGLAHGAGEAVAVARLWERGKALTEAKATEATVKRFGGKFDLLHFAAPTLYAADDPLASAIYLTPDGADGDDGMLDVREIFALPLHADLVTLSGATLPADTPFGRGGADRAGTAIAFIGQSFLSAGAGSLVATLWALPEHARFTLMTSFYRFLADSGPMDALRRAQQVVRARYPHPAGWAGVQLYGLPGAPRSDDAAVAQRGPGAVEPAAGLPLDGRYVVLKGANLRAEPTTLSARIGSLAKGTEVQVMEQVPDSAWLRVAQNGEPVGYIFGPLVGPVAP